MARITNAVLYRLKHEVSLVKLCRSRGMRFKPAPGREGELTGKCPFHRDRDGSFVVIAGNNLFHCANCRAGGNALDFVVKADGVDYRQAAEKLLAALPDIRMTTSMKGTGSHAANS